MLGHVALSETPISSISKILEGNAEMSGLASTASAGIGILAGIAEISGNFTQTSTGAVVPDIPVTTIDFNFTKTSSAVFVKGTNQEIDINFNIDQSTAGNVVLTGVSTQDFSFTKTSVGELQFEDLATQDSVESFSDLSTSSSTETFTDLNTQTNTETFTDLET
jgi:hypothetical protein